MSQFLDSPTRLLRQPWYFVTTAISRFAIHGGPQNAAALTYATLLSIVPFMTVMLAAFSAFPMGDRAGELLQDFVFENFMPGASDVVQTYLEDFSANASRLSGVGFLFLILVALMMMGNMDRALNAIWEVKRKRRLIHTFMVYWAVITLGPVFIGLSVAATSYVVSIPFLSDAATSGLGLRLVGLAPVIASTLAFAFVFLLVPNRRVPIRHALAGGLVSALLFEMVKRAFGFYITHFPTYEAIYGALAAIPIFLVWVYLSWMVLLFGAEFTRLLGLYRLRRWDYREAVESNLVNAVLVLSRLASCNKVGLSLSLAAMLKGESAWNEPQLERLLYELKAGHFVHQTDQDEWVVAKDLDQIRVYDLYQALPGGLPTMDGQGEMEHPRLADVLRQADNGIADVFSLSIRELIESSSK